MRQEAKNPRRDDQLTREFFAGASLWVLAKKHGVLIAEAEAIVRRTVKSALLADLRERRNAKA